ncbi:hypothetical protein PR202_gb00499 [Eleusine coracana subsp. coracana]|uniref:Uncharacterized protein n=1 Tax=Eleusine coracana subsp. coracana TaxID=191504 RepID=A0AAV5DTH2_ELECO|nr:hypothetical protein PR202_gb00499 [Eleusine coracana subsp. coracana]
MAVAMRDKGYEYDCVYDVSKKTVCFSRSASSGSVNWSGFPKVEMKNGPAKQFGYTPGRVIIIDLGNTNSCFAGYDPDNPKTMFQFCIPPGSP